MRYLLDTHIWLWMMVEPEQITPQVLALVSSEENQLYVSLASYWELQIRANLARVQLPDNMISTSLDEGISILDISVLHIEALRHLPLIHRDPFDRLILATSHYEQLPLISVDSELSAYKAVAGIELVSG